MLPEDGRVLLGSPSAPIGPDPKILSRVRAVGRPRSAKWRLWVRRSRRCPRARSLVEPLAAAWGVSLGFRGPVRGGCFCGMQSRSSPRIDSPMAIAFKVWTCPSRRRHPQICSPHMTPFEKTTEWVRKSSSGPEIGGLEDGHLSSVFGYFFAVSVRHFAPRLFRGRTPRRP